MMAQQNKPVDWRPRIPYKNIPNTKGLRGLWDYTFNPFPKGWVGNRYVELDPVLSEDGLNIELSSKRRQELISNIYSKRQEDYKRIQKRDLQAANPLNWATPKMIGMVGSALNKHVKERIIGGQYANVSPDQIAEFGGTGTRITNRKWDRLVEKAEEENKKVQEEHGEWNRQESIRVTEAEKNAFQLERDQRLRDQVKNTNLISPTIGFKNNSTNEQVTKSRTDDRKIEEPIARTGEWSDVFHTLDEDGNPMVLTNKERSNFEKEFADVPLDELPNRNRNRWIWGG